MPGATTTILVSAQPIPRTCLLLLLLLARPQTQGLAIKHGGLVRSVLTWLSRSRLSQSAEVAADSASASSFCAARGTRVDNPSSRWFARVQIREEKGPHELYGCVYLRLEQRRPAIHGLRQVRDLCHRLPDRPFLLC